MAEKLMKVNGIFIRFVDGKIPGLKETQVGQPADRKKERKRFSVTSNVFSGNVD